MNRTKYFLYQWSIKENETLYCLGVEVDAEDTQDVSDQIVLQCPTELLEIIELQAFLGHKPNRLAGDVTVRWFASLEGIQWAINHGA